MRFRLAFSATAAICVAMLNGCGCIPYVDEKQYLDTALSPGVYEMAEAPRAPYRADYDASYRPSGGVDLGPLHYEEPDPAIIDMPTRRITKNQAAFVANVINDLEAMRNALLRIMAYAQQRGAYAQAALEPKLRDFREYVELIQEYLLDEPGYADPEDWDATATKVNDALSEAYEAVREAAIVVQEASENYRYPDSSNSWLTTFIARWR